MFPSEAQTYQAFQNQYKGLIGWIRIEFRKWMTLDYSEPCLIAKSGRGQGRCSKPCETCLDRLDGNLR